MEGGKSRHFRPTSAGTAGSDLASADGAAGMNAGMDTGTSESNQLDPAVRDALIKRAEAEALQRQHDQETTNTKTHEEEAAKKLPSKKDGHWEFIHGFTKGRANQQKQLEATAGETNQAVVKEEEENVKGEEIRGMRDQTSLVTSQEDGNKKYKQEHKNTSIEARVDNTSQSHRLSFFTAVDTPVKGLATTQALKEDNDAKQGEHNNMATEINENAEEEENKTAANTLNTANSIEQGEGLNRQSAELAAVLPAALPEPIPLQRQQHQPMRPGAYRGIPGEALQRATTLRYSLVGAGAGAAGQGELLVPSNSTDHHDSSTLNQTNNALHTSRERQLAVANLVLEDDTADLMHANPVDLEAAQHRALQKKQQQKTFLAAVRWLLLVTAIIVGFVVGTQKKGPEVIVSPSTDAPTVYGSMEPSEVPSSAPTGALDILLDTLPNYTLASINNGSETPQWKAWRWLAEHQNITFLPEWRKEQLCALATCFYSLQGENWWQPIQDRWMDDTVEECNWFSIEYGTFSMFSGAYIQGGSESPCNDLGQYTSLNLQGLELSGLDAVLPPEVTLMTSLSKLHLVDSDIAGPLSSFFPAGFFRRIALTSLKLSENMLSGSVPSEFGLLTTLEDLRLNQNLLTGLLPSELGLLTSVRTLRLADNQWSGWIPSELGLLPLQIKFDLVRTPLTGPLPSELGLLTSLSFLYFFDNQFTGPLPSELGKLTLRVGYSWMKISFTRIPSELGLSTSLEWLYLSDNQLSSQVPSELGLLTSLHYLRLQSNRLTGPIPSELGLQALFELNLSENRLTGQIAAELGLLTSLGCIDLFNNWLSGPLPSELGLLTSLGRLSLFDNQLSGQIPSEVGMMTYLSSLDLYNNSLTGTLLSQLNASMGLKLYGNHFSELPLIIFVAFFGVIVPLLKRLPFPPVLTSKKLHLIGLDGFPTMPGSVMLNIQTYDWLEETSWVWQKKETNNATTGTWDTLESGGPLKFTNYLYSSLFFPVITGTAYRLIVTAPYGYGMPSGWITLTATNDETVLYSLEAGEAFFNITIGVLVGADGSSFDITNSSTV